MDEENDPILRFSANNKNIDTAPQRQGNCFPGQAEGADRLRGIDAKPPISMNMDRISFLTFTGIRTILAT
ncbi:MAG: hypothetical protein KFF77_07765 [Bacteroidetes bacterium]|nr:hypothetical protein [Bacteroidota bacterium]